jgi:uncharacterized integral membrane protein
MHKVATVTPVTQDSATTDASPSNEKDGVMWMIVSFLMAALAVILAMQNGAPATIHFFSWTFAQSQGIVLLVGFIAGFIASMLIYLPTHIRNKLKIRHHERRETDLERQLNTERDKRE